MLIVIQHLGFRRYDGETSVCWCWKLRKMKTDTELSNWCDNVLKTKTWATWTVPNAVLCTELHIQAPKLSHLRPILSHVCRTAQKWTYHLHTKCIAAGQPCLIHLSDHNFHLVKGLYLTCPPWLSLIHFLSPILSSLVQTDLSHNSFCVHSRIECTTMAVFSYITATTVYGTLTWHPKSP